MDSDTEMASLRASLIPWRVSDQLHSQTTLRWVSEGPEDTPSQRPATMIRDTGTIRGRRHVGNPSTPSPSQSSCCAAVLLQSFGAFRRSSRSVAEKANNATWLSTARRQRNQGLSDSDSADLCLPEKKQSKHLKIS